MADTHNLAQYPAKQVPDTYSKSSLKLNLDLTKNFLYLKMSLLRRIQNKINVKLRLLNGYSLMREGKRKT
jgi:hypothetical protein